MFAKRLYKVSLFVLSLLLLFVSVICLQPTSAVVLSAATTGVSFTSPLSTPVATPLPASTPSLQARIAVQYIAVREGIPLTNLLIAHEHPRSFPLLGRQFMAFTIFDQAARRSFHVMVDLKDGNVVDDVATVEQAEADARRVKYGKLQPALYERLQTADTDEMLPVAIWVGGEYGRSRETLYDILADRYPEVHDALAHHLSPFDVHNPGLSQRIQSEYEQMHQADIATRLNPVVTYLKSQGTNAKTHFLLPSITVTLTKSAILELAKRDDVQTVYLVEGILQPALDSSMPTNHVAPLWSAGIIGTPITVAVVENGNVDPNNSFLHFSTVSPLISPNGAQNHTTRVASAAASFHSIYRGMAYGATILSAGEDGTASDIQLALNWALDRGTNVSNLSELFNSNTPDLEWLDRAFDYTTRVRQAAITVPAGNYRDQIIGSPAKAWNVITVGGINDQGDAD